MNSQSTFEICIYFEKDMNQITWIMQLSKT